MASKTIHPERWAVSHMPTEGGGKREWLKVVLKMEHKRRQNSSNRQGRGHVWGGKETKKLILERKGN